ncbi:hypothetical protein COCSUDRAFT_63060 [Coccomyxa subellipsoidea C-169]|uniref:Uncharacterized protein n=1 Tax=Coccomyxa subellipsoidea (strain C-169) TaxID=574566 RepID=I0YYQ7_COCSC|nr:hypothetical protein COCSUDRAFT_63060 [Coccomyxa subellipsoidea C-169]EIE23526.1 hypothetical protein COCSUDRAFT_63060 [Coccomyxa subellipsoidea C-169]|eukprot:XP_005648070.1 hypothetical protein COCSUDRAFT_63060 [Coccomyxa subellipsoidea C-169]
MLDSMPEVAWSFNVLSSTGVFDDSITVHIRTTAKRGTSDPMTGPFRPVPHVTELPSSAKGCPNGQFSGSEVSFAVTADACHWLDLLNAVQAAVETSLMVAPPASLEQRIQGFDEHVQGMGLEPLPKKIQFALEPPLDTMTPSERLTEGLRAYFLEAPMPEPAELLPSSQEPDTSQQTAVFVSSDQAGAAPRPRSGVKLLLFENYGLLQRPQDGILKALERVDWVQYNMPLEGIVKHADGSATLKFAQTVDQSSTDIRLIVFHLVSSELSFKKPKKGLMPPGLWLQLEACLEQIALDVMAAAANSSQAAVSQGADAEVEA